MPNVYSARQQRKQRKERNTDKRVSAWMNVIKLPGGIAYALKHGVDVSANGNFINCEHLPELPKEYPEGLYR